MKKIMIIGCGGSGKSTLARKLGESLGIEVVHLDQYFWMANWVSVEKKAWTQMVEQLSDKQEWILDGNYGGTMDIRLKKADAVIFMDRSRWLCLYRVLKRLIRSYGKTRIDMAEGCTERFSWKFMHYIFFYNDTRRPTILEKLAQLSSKQIVFHFKGEKDIQQFLFQIQEKKDRND